MIKQKSNKEISILNINNITTPTSGVLDYPFSFQHKKILLHNHSNKIGVLMDAFVEWHFDAPQEDFQNLSGRLGQICKLLSNDYGYVLELLWLSVPRSPSGSHLNYIQGMIKNKKSSIKRDDPDRYVKGKYGHMVQQ